MCNKNYLKIIENYKEKKILIKIYLKNNLKLIKKII